MKTRNNKLRGIVAVFATIALFTNYCAKSEETAAAAASTGSLPTKLTAAQLTVESDASYDNNSYGVISGSKLESWLSNWSANKPAAITGKLVILQNRTTNVVGSQNITPDNTNIFVYVSTDFNIDVTGSNERSTGVVTAATIVDSGSEIDKFLNKYKIDPTKDLIVLAPGRGEGNGDLSATGRIWYALRYWGVEKEHLAILNGAVKYEIRKTYLSDATSPAIPTNEQGNFTVKSLRRDATAYQIDTGELIDKIKNSPNSIWISDARGANEWAGIANSTAGNGSGVTAFDAHLKGAKHTPWQAFIDNVKRADDSNYAANESYLLNGGFKVTSSYRFKSKAALKTYLETTKGYPTDKSKEFIVYCRTNTRSQASGIVGAILGYPTRYYDGSWSEWSSLSGYNTDTTRNTVFSGDSAFQFATDKDELNGKTSNATVTRLTAVDATTGAETQATGVAVAAGVNGEIDNSPTIVAGVTYSTNTLNTWPVNRNGTTVKAIINADTEYKRQ